MRFEDFLIFRGRNVFPFQRDECGRGRTKKEKNVAPFFLPYPFLPLPAVVSSLCLNPRLGSRVSNEGETARDRTKGFDKWLTWKKIRVDTSCCAEMRARGWGRKRKRNRFQAALHSDSVSPNFCFRWKQERYRIVSDEFSREKRSNDPWKIVGSTVLFADACFIGKHWVRYMERLYEMGFQNRTAAAILRSDNYANFDCREINGRRRRPLLAYTPRCPRCQRPDVPSAFDRPCIMQQTCNYCRLRADLFSYPCCELASRLC